MYIITLLTKKCKEPYELRLNNIKEKGGKITNMRKPGIYKLKEEFFPMNKISRAQYDTRKEDLLEW